MKRYFDIPEHELVIDVGVNEISGKYTIRQMEKALKIKGLREVNKEEFENLKGKYMGALMKEK